MKIYRFISRIHCVVLLLIVTSCRTLPVSNRDIHAALCNPMNAESTALPYSASIEQIGTNNMTGLILTMKQDSPLLSGKYAWSMQKGSVAADGLAAYWVEHGTLISENDACIRLYAVDKYRSRINGEMTISTSYGLNAKVCFEVEVVNGGLIVREARVPLISAADCRGGIVIITNVNSSNAQTGSSETSELVQ